MKLSSLTEGVLDTDSRAATGGAYHPIIPTPPVAGEALPPRGESIPPVSPSPSDVGDSEDIFLNIKDLEEAASLIDQALVGMDAAHGGALGTVSHSLKELHRLLLGHITDAKQTVKKHLKRHS